MGSFGIETRPDPAVAGNMNNSGALIYKPDFIIYIYP
jgi:hypothetical protein